MAALHVIDLGLDYKSFALYVDDQGHPLLGNQFHFPVEEVSDKFLPTCGLLTAVLHGYASTASSPKGQTWLDQYRKLQAKLFDETKSIEAANTLSFLAQYPSPMAAPLFDMLDRQMNMVGGSNAPSQRRLNADSKHALCNLHLNEHACHQGLHCNQLHLSSERAQHRHDFYSQVHQVLKTNGLSDDTIRARLLDSMFFAKYGNRVTVDHHGQHFQFFKTAYSDARVAKALRLVANGEINVLPGMQPHRPQRLTGDPQDIIRELTMDVNEIVDEQASPTTRKWNAVIASFVDRNPTDTHHAIGIAPGLAKHLNTQRMAEASTSQEDGITPLLESVHRKTFDTSG
jgi:hypothetical protein